jgi:hypothetical protein
MRRAVRGGPRTRSGVSARAKRREPSLAAFFASSRATRRCVLRRASPERMQAASSCPSCVFRLTPTSSSSCHTRSSLTSCVAALVARFSRPPARHCYHRQAPCPASFRHRVRLPLSSYTLSRANRAGSKAPPPATSPETVRQRLQIGCADILPRRHLLRSLQPSEWNLR